MFRKKSYWIFLGALFLLFILILVISPKPINWQPTFSKRHKYPYGNAATFQLLENIFPGQTISVSNEPPYTLLDSSRYGQNYLLVTGKVDMGDEDALKLLHAVDSGCNAFIAAEEFSGLLADTLGLATNVRFDYDFMTQTTDSVTVNFANPGLKEAQPFRFKKYEVQFYFDESEIDEHFVLGEASDSTVNFIRIPFGNGSFYLHSCPLLFTNYNLLHSADHHHYISKAWSYLPLRATIWDEYYNTGRNESTTPVRYILSRPQLKWAWFTILGMGLLFLLFQSKRRQRVIPVVKPLRNTTLEFVSTVGQLYFHQKNHTNLARKKAVYFLEGIRNTYQMRTDVLDEEFIRQLSAKSGVDEGTVRNLTGLFRTLAEGHDIKEDFLLKLNKAIEDFNLKSKS